MEIRNSVQNGVTVVEVIGNIDSNTAPQAQGTIMPLIVAGSLLVLDMGQCHYVSSAGLRVLLMVAKLISTKGGRCALANVADEVKDVMEITGFAHLFKNHDTVPVAVQAIKG